MLRLEVADSGKNLPYDVEELAHAGLGLTNTRARLRQLYGEAHEFTMEKDARGGTVVSLEFSFRAAPEARVKEDLYGNSSDHRG